jgi:hypothetical protein
MPSFCREHFKQLLKESLLLKLPSGAPVSHAYNPSYSGGRDQEDLGSQPIQANSSQDPILKKTQKPITEKGW